jgi:hypothetical protein
VESILTSIKKLLGIEEEYEHFDADIIMHINSVLMILHQLGVGPSEGFQIQDKEASWIDFVSEEDNLEAIKTYIAKKVQLMFDPPTQGTVMESVKELNSELEWRLAIAADSKTPS